MSQQRHLHYPLAATLKKILRSRQINFAIKLLIVMGLLSAIYFQVFARENAEDLWRTFLENFTFTNIHWLVLTLALVPVNWGFETCKWQELIKGFSKLNFWQTYRAILAGITVSLFTPNRVGEYGGRVLLVKPKNNWKAIVATLVGSFSQLITLLSIGILGAVYFVFNYIQDDWNGLWGAMFLGSIFISVLLFGFFNVRKLLPIAQQLPYYQKFKRYFLDLRVLTEYTAPQLTKALGYSFLRYATYSLQYYLLLQFFGIEVPLIAAWAGIATIFLLQTSIPLPPVIGLLARGEIALGIWGFFNASELSILAASFSLFVINLTIPALLGAMFIIKINVVKSLGYGNEDDN